MRHLFVDFSDQVCRLKNEQPLRGTLWVSMKGMGDAENSTKHCYMTILLVKIEMEENVYRRISV